MINIFSLLGIFLISFSLSAEPLPVSPPNSIRVLPKDVQKFLMRNFKFKLKEVPSNYLEAFAKNSPDGRPRVFTAKPKAIDCPNEIYAYFVSQPPTESSKGFQVFIYQNTSNEELHQLIDGDEPATFERPVSPDIYFPLIPEPTPQVSFHFQKQEHFDGKVIRYEESRIGSDGNSLILSSTSGVCTTFLKLKMSCAEQERYTLSLASRRDDLTIVAQTYWRDEKGLLNQRLCQYVSPSDPKP